jgi:hypothetical protein
MRKFIGVISLILAVFLVAATLQFVMAAPTPGTTPGSSKPPSTQIEIVPDKNKTPAPAPTSAKKEWKGNDDSGNANPFNPITEPVNTGPGNSQPTAAPTLPSKSTTPSTLKPGQTPGATPPSPVVTATATPSGNAVQPVVTPKKTEAIGIGAQLFKYKGVLWNGDEYVGIITSAKKSFIAKSGSDLDEGYRVLYLNYKEAVLVKEGVKSTLLLQEVAK